MTDDEIMDAMRADGRPCVLVRHEGGQVKVITTQTADAIPLMELAIKGLTTPKDTTLQ